MLDVDGVLTGGEIIYDTLGRESKSFNVKDGLGIFLLGKAGIKTVLLSARNSAILKKRADDMRVVEVIGGLLPKEKALNYLKTKYRLKADQICFVGDDLIDLGMIKAVGLGIAVSDSSSDVRKAADYVTVKKGGQGAVREVIDLIIQHQGLKKQIYAFLKNFK